METKENKYPYLGAYEIEQVKKENTEEILERLNSSRKKYKRLYWELEHYGKASILISKGGVMVQSLDFNEDTNPHGIRIDELKETAQSLEKIYQDYESNIESTIILKTEWDETKE